MKQKKSTRSQVRLALAYDIGGTKISVGIVTANGKILSRIKENTLVQQGKRGFIQQLKTLGQNLIKDYPNVKSVGLASAGPLDLKKGSLLEATNLHDVLKNSPKGWGVVPLVKPLQKFFDLPVALDNDAAAAIRAEHWLGHAKNQDNVMILTLGTGVGVGVICNGGLQRSGRHLHPEGSHISLNIHDTTAPCGCGLFGCVEAYLSGKNFERRFQKQYQLQWMGPQILEAARSAHPAARQALQDYSVYLAHALQSYVVLYSPEKIIFSGGFSAAFPFFYRPTLSLLKKLLRRRRVGIDLLPQLLLSKLGTDAGLYGAARSAFTLIDTPNRDKTKVMQRTSP